MKPFRKINCVIMGLYALYLLVDIFVDGAYQTDYFIFFLAALDFGLMVYFITTKMASILGCNILTIKKGNGEGDESMDNKVQNLDMQTTERNDTFGDEAPEEFEEYDDKEEEDIKGASNNSGTNGENDDKILVTDETLQFGDF